MCPCPATTPWGFSAAASWQRGAHRSLCPFILGPVLQLPLWSQVTLIVTAGPVSCLFSLARDVCDALVTSQPWVVTLVLGGSGARRAMDTASRDRSRASLRSLSPQLQRVAGGWTRVGLALPMGHPPRGDSFRIGPVLCLIQNHQESLG